MIKSLALVSNDTVTRGSHDDFEEDLALDRDLELDEDREQAKLAAVLTPDG